MANPKYATLVANTVATVTLDADYDVVRVTNVDGAGSAAVYVTTDGSTPAAADGSDVVPGIAGSYEVLGVSTEGPSVVKLKSTGTPLVQVKGLHT